MQHNSPLPKQITGQNQVELFKMFIYISKIVPRDPQANKSNFEKINRWQISHANGNTEISSAETLVAKELALVILQP